MKKLIHKFNHKAQKIFILLSNLSNKQILLLCISIGILFFVYKTYQDFYAQDTAQNLQQSQIITSQEIKYLHNWYENDYRKEREKGNQFDGITVEQIKARYHTNIDPTLQLIYKIPKYLNATTRHIQQNETLIPILSAMLEVHTRYYALQKFFQSPTDEQELDFLNELFVLQNTLINLDCDATALMLGINLYVYVSVFLKQREYQNYCDNFDILIWKRKILQTQIDTLFKSKNSIYTDKTMRFLHNQFESIKGDFQVKICQ